MNNNTNIYDIDGDLLRKSTDKEELTIEEAESRIKKYEEKLNKLAETDPKDHRIAVYNTYIKNLQYYVFNQYLLHPELRPTMPKTTEDEIKKAMEDLKNEVENEEYVDFEEVKEDTNE